MPDHAGAFSVDTAVMHGAGASMKRVGADLAGLGVDLSAAFAALGLASGDGAVADAAWGAARRWGEAALLGGAAVGGIGAALAAAASGYEVVEASACRTLGGSA